MKMETNEKSGSDRARLVAALLAGTLIGAGLALLFAPASGRETRDNLMRRANGLADDLKDQFRREFAGAGRRTEDPEKDHPV